MNDLLDLQLCREGVISAMKSEDFEKAAAHVHRFLSIDETTLKLTAGDVAQGTEKNAIAIVVIWCLLVIYYLNILKVQLWIVL